MVNWPCKLTSWPAANCNVYHASWQVQDWLQDWVDKLFTQPWVWPQGPAAHNDDATTIDPAPGARRHEKFLTPTTCLETTIVPIQSGRCTFLVQLFHWGQNLHLQEAMSRKLWMQLNKNDNKSEWSEDESGHKTNHLINHLEWILCLAIAHVKKPCSEWKLGSRLEDAWRFQLVVN